MSTMEPDEGAQPDDEREDAPRWEKTEAANPTDAPRWEGADADAADADSDDPDSSDQ